LNRRRSSLGTAPQPGDECERIGLLGRGADLLKVTDPLQDPGVGADAASDARGVIFELEFDFSTRDEAQAVADVLGDGDLPLLETLLFCTRWLALVPQIMGWLASN